MNDKGNEEFSCSGNNVIASGAGHRESIRRAPRPLNTNLSWKKGNESRGILFSFHVNLPRGWKNPSEQHKFVVGLLLSNYSLVIQRLTSCIPFKKKKKIHRFNRLRSLTRDSSLFYYSTIIFPDYWTNSYKVVSFVKRQITNSLLRKRFTFSRHYILETVETSQDHWPE